MKGRRLRRRIGVAAVAGAIAATTLIVPVAEATDRFVEPGGSMAGFCTDPDPGSRCDLEYAIETAAMPNDRVLLAAGSYSETSDINVDEAGVAVIGPGSPAATLTTSAANSFQLIGAAPGSSLSGLRIVHTNAGFSALVISGNDTLVERVHVSTPGPGACAVSAMPTAVTIRDTVCQTTNGPGAIVVTPNESTLVTLRNVTAFTTASGANGLYAFAQLGDDPVVNARNSIFRGTDTGRDIDVFRDANPGSTITVDADFSSFADTNGASDGDPLTTVTAPGSLSNIVDPPVFSFLGLNLNQAAGSPTIDRGSPAFASSLDIDGEARSVNSTGACSTLPDIGADERATAVPPAPSCLPVAGPNPQPQPKAKKCKKRKAKKGAVAAKKKKGCKKRKKK